MRKIFLFMLAGVLITAGLSAQDTTQTAPKKKKRDWSKIDLGNRANDHFMMQFGYDGWAGRPDTIRTKGFSRHFNMYVMLDLPFKTDKRFSVGLGAGFGSSNIFLNNTYVDVAGKLSTSKLSFQNADSINHFKKYKVVNVWLEAPVELRWVAQPGNSDRSFKAAIGFKVGTMLNAHTKGKNLVTKSGTSVYSAKYVAKESDKRFFNSTRLAATARVGWGNFSIYGAYQITNLLKDGAGPELRPFSIGLCLSGL